MISPKTERVERVSYTHSRENESISSVLLPTTVTFHSKEVEIRLNKQEKSCFVSSVTARPIEGQSFI